MSARDAAVPAARLLILVELYANSVMRGTPRCNLTVANDGVARPLRKLCPALGTTPSSSLSARITGTLTAPAAGNDRNWYRFGICATNTTWTRLWIDDHRLVDAWGPHGAADLAAPVTPALLPNVTLSATRPVSVRVDMRPMGETLRFELRWTDGGAAAPARIADTALSPRVSAAQRARRKLQEAAATGWNQWARPSQLAQIVLPQQVGVDLGVRESGGKLYRHALLAPQFPAKDGSPPVPVRLGHHAYDGSYSSLSFVPFPAGTRGVAAASALNLTVQSAVEVGTGAGAAEAEAAYQRASYVIVQTNASSAAAARAANLSLEVCAAAFWGADAALSVLSTAHDGARPGLRLDAGELGVLQVTFSQPPLPPAPVTQAQAAQAAQAAPTLAFALTAEPLVILLSFEPGAARAPDEARARELVAAGAAEARAHVAAASAAFPFLAEAYDAMFTAIAWNVNFDPRVAVTVPVSRTFEANFDFIFFDWDMFFLSLMAGTAPAAEHSPAAWRIAVSNMIEVAQTRSAYGQVMNKRAAAGSSSSDSNDRTEPLVGAMVVWRVLADAQGTAREEDARWAAELLLPTLLRWNEWSWEQRRYNATGAAGEPVAGDGNRSLLVLGNDNNPPCEGSTVGLNSSKGICANRGQTILESGMDNAPMYYNAFDGAPASYDAEASRLQLYDVQQSALFVSEARALQRLVDAVSATETAGAGTAAAAARMLGVLREREQAVARSIDRVLWDERTGIYRQVDASPARRGFSAEISPTSFYPMLGAVPSAARAKRMVRAFLTNASEFCVNASEPFGNGGTARVAATAAAAAGGGGGGGGSGGLACPFALPVVPRSSAYFHDNTYWRGRTWGPVNLLTWLALSEPAYSALPPVRAARRGLCAQSLRLLMGEWRAHRRVHENYNSTTGRGGDVPDSNPFYHWGALLGYIGMREIHEHGDGSSPPAGAAQAAHAAQAAQAARAAQAAGALSPLALAAPTALGFGFGGSV
eukprot:g301.t1